MIQTNIPSCSPTHETIINHYKEYRYNSNRKLVSILGMKLVLYFVMEVGQGGYGTVVSARDKGCENQISNMVAIKKIENPFEHKVFAKRTLRELKILRLLKHENIVNLKTILLPPSREEFNDIYLVSDIMETDLSKIIKSTQPLSIDYIQFFLYQLVRGLKYIHSAGILHRDLKPRNLFVDSNCDLKIGDFGLARYISKEFKTTGAVTNYVATRWFRAPELILNYSPPNSSQDIWSVGCILAEMLRRRPLFPGENSQTQLELIFNVLGTPSLEDIEEIKSQSSLRYLKARMMKPKKPKNLNLLFAECDDSAVDLLSKMLVFNPHKRITLDEALEHPFLNDLHCESDEPLFERLNSKEFEFEYYDFTLEQYKDLIYEEILIYHSAEFKHKYFNYYMKRSNPFEHILKNANANIRTVGDSESYDDESDIEDEQNLF